MKEILKVPYNIIRGITRFAFYIVLVIVIKTIYLITYEPGTKNKITVRKAKRIRALSKFKLFAFNHLPEEVTKFLGIENYKQKFNYHLKNGLQLRYN